MLTLKLKQWRLTLVLQMICRGSSWSYTHRGVVCTQMLILDCTAKLQKLTLQYHNLFRKGRILFWKHFLISNFIEIIAIRSLCLKRYQKLTLSDITVLAATFNSTMIITDWFCLIGILVTSEFKSCRGEPSFYSWLPSFSHSRPPFTILSPNPLLLQIVLAPCHIIGTQASQLRPPLPASSSTAPLFQSCDSPSVWSLWTLF